MQLPEDVVDDVRRRLRRAGGQVNGVERMLADGRTYCLEHPQDAMADGYPLESLEKLFKNFG